MLGGRSSATGPKSGATESAGKRSNGSGGVLNRVLGSLRRVPRDGDAIANNREDNNWANNYKITHRPDRPRHDRREVKHRNSAYVLGQLRKIWQYNEKMREVKKRERESREAAPASEWKGARSQNQRNQGADTSNSTNSNSTSRRDRPHVPSLQTDLDLVPNFSWKAPSPEYARGKWHADSEEQQHQSTLHRATANEGGSREEQRGALVYLPSSPSALSDKMTIRVGMVQSPYLKEGSGGFTRSSGGAQPGGHSHVHHKTSSSSSTPLSAPKSRASTALSQAAPLYLSSAQKEVARGQQMHPLSRSPPDRLRANYVALHQTTMLQRQSPLDITMQTSSTRSIALRRTTKTPLYINTDQDSTPSLVLNSSPVSEQASPLTPIDVASDDKRIHGKTQSEPEPQASKKCPMPLCDNPLLTAADQKHNLCAGCRNELQPRHSVFTTELLNPFSYTYPSTNAYATSRTPLFPDVQRDPSAEANEAELKKSPERVRYLNSESKRTRTAHHRGGNQSADRVRKTEISPTALRRKKSGHATVASRFNKDRGEFKLQSVALGRKYSRRGQRPHVTPTRSNESNNAKGRNHIGFQLADWPAPAPAPNPIPQPSPPLDPPQRKLSGPLLEPKTFCPTASPARKNLVARCKLSDARPRAKGGGPTSSGGLEPSLPRVHVERTGIRKGSSPKSPGYRRGRHPTNPPHLGDRATGLGPGVPGAREFGGMPSPKAEDRPAVDNEDIYREIEIIIDCYLRQPDVSESENEKRKAEAVASYFAAVPLEVEMRTRGFI
ncbi:hypothetical protein F4825DRAFT_325326 [Nemania diffusa]|nr:hypothetical protein F4825DRAFT_325326 [Nemania diffusa]